MSWNQDSIGTVDVEMMRITVQLFQRLNVFNRFFEIKLTLPMHGVATSFDTTRTETILQFGEKTILVPAAGWQISFFQMPR